MTNKSEMVSVPRELLERISEPGSMSLQDKNRLRALLAAPPEDVRAVVDELVATVVTIKKQSLPMLIAGKYQPSITSEEKVAMFDVDLPNGTKLYRHPQRPVVMPERKQIPVDYAYRSGWNACLEEFKRLNP